MPSKPRSTKAKPITLTLTNDDLLLAQRGLQALAQRPLPVTTGMAVRRLLRVVNPLAEDIQEERKKLVKTFALLDDRGEIQEDEDGEIRFKSEDDRTTYIAEHRELMDLETELSAIPLLASSLAEEELPPALLVALSDLLVDDLD